MSDYHIEYSPESRLNLEKIAQYYLDALGYERAMNVMDRLCGGGFFVFYADALPKSALASTYS